MNTLNKIKAELRLMRNYKADSPLVPEVKRLLRMAEQHDNSNIELRQTIEERKFEGSCRTEPAPYGMTQQVWEPVIAVYFWSRDCDMAEASYARLLPASVLHYLKAECDLYDNAEGACSMHIMTEADYLDFQPTFRDRAAEQMNY